MWRILAETTRFVSGVIADTLRMFFSIFYTNGKINFIGWFFFAYMTIALLSTIIDPLIDYFSGSIRNIGTDILSKFGVEVDDNDEN